MKKGKPALLVIIYKPEVMLELYNEDQDSLNVYLARYAHGCYHKVGG
jgi:hypothetical protein